jgi:hypothetical protein
MWHIHCNYQTCICITVHYRPVWMFESGLGLRKVEQTRFTLKLSVAASRQTVFRSWYIVVSSGCPCWTFPSSRRFEGALGWFPSTSETLTMNFYDHDSTASCSLFDVAVWKGNTNLRLQGLQASIGVAFMKFDFLLCFLTPACNVVKVFFCMRW